MTLQAAWGQGQGQQPLAACQHHAQSVISKGQQTPQALAAAALATALWGQPSASCTAGCQEYNYLPFSSAFVCLHKQRLHSNQRRPILMNLTITELHDQGVKVRCLLLEVQHPPTLT
jgi:hypothetical protein